MPSIREKVRRKVSRAIRDFEMFTRKDKLLIALSGGKDSVTLLLVMRELNYTIEALYIDLGVPSFSEVSEKVVREICERENIPLHIVRAEQEKQISVQNVTQEYPSKECNICGTLKRQLFNRFALENRFDVLLVAHNLDDEAAMLFGNNRNWDFSYLRKSLPVLHGKPGFVKRAKPLCYVREEETKLYTRDLSLPVVSDSCPFSTGKSRRKYDEILEFSDERFTGFTETYYRSFLGNAALLQSLPEEQVTLQPCEECGELSATKLCRLCAVKQGLWRKS